MRIRRRESDRGAAGDWDPAAAAADLQAERVRLHELARDLAERHERDRADARAELEQLKQSLRERAALVAGRERELDGRESAPRGPAGRLERLRHARLERREDALDRREAALDEVARRQYDAAAVLARRERDLAGRLKGLEQAAQPAPAQPAPALPAPAQPPAVPLVAEIAALDAQARALLEREQALEERSRRLEEVEERELALAERAARLEAAEAGLEARRSGLDEAEEALDAGHVDGAAAALADRERELQDRSVELEERQSELEERARELTLASARLAAEHASIRAQERALARVRSPLPSLRRYVGFSEGFEAFARSRRAARRG
jgi:hypothetical protein